VLGLIAINWARRLVRCKKSNPQKLEYYWLKCSHCPKAANVIRRSWCFTSRPWDISGIVWNPWVYSWLLCHWWSRFGEASGERPGNRSCSPSLPQEIRSVPTSMDGAEWLWFTSGLWRDGEEPESSGEDTSNSMFINSLDEFIEWEKAQEDLVMEN